MSDWETFLSELGKFIPENMRMIACQFRGVPGEPKDENWAPLRYRPEIIDEGANVYICVSAVTRNENSEWRRATRFCGAALCLMIDDIGSGPGSKFPLSLISRLRPTAMVETSPNNYQAIYMFDGAMTDMALFDKMIKGFIAKEFLGKDTGQAGINRVFRPPIGVNGKRKYIKDGKLWRVRLAKADYSLRYTPQQIIDAFAIPIIERRKPPEGESLHSAEINDRKQIFRVLRREFLTAGMITSEVRMDGWFNIHCPWEDGHSRGPQQRTGTALREPDPDNDWLGGFKCQHGTCADVRNMGDVLSWMKGQSNQFSGAMAAIGSKAYQRDIDILNKQAIGFDFDAFIMGLDK